MKTLSRDEIMEAMTEGISREVLAAMCPQMHAALTKVQSGIDEASKASTTGSMSFDSYLNGLSDSVGALEVKGGSMVLQKLEPEEDRVSYDGKTYKRLKDSDLKRSYVDLRGDISAYAGRFREEGLRNGPTIVPLELRAGIVESMATGRAAVAASHLQQAVPTDEAVEMAESCRVLPTSSSTIGRLARLFGMRWSDFKLDGEDAVIKAFEIPAQACSVAVEVDRVNVPFAEPRELTAEEKQSKKPQKNPITVVYYQAYVGALLFCDAEGNTLTTRRYGEMAAEGASARLEESMHYDLNEILQRAPTLKLASVSDGAKEMANVLGRITDGFVVEHAGTDFWHTASYTNKAAKHFLPDAEEPTLSTSFPVDTDPSSSVDQSVAVNDDEQISERSAFMRKLLLEDKDGARKVLTLLAIQGFRHEQAQLSQLSDTSTLSETAAAMSAREVLLTRQEEVLLGIAKLDMDSMTDDKGKEVPVPAIPGAPEDLYAAFRYVWNHRTGCHFARALALNLPIGSGGVEASCKTIVAVRFKRSGARWKYNGAQSTMNMRCHAKSGSWKSATTFLCSTYRCTVTAA